MKPLHARASRSRVWKRELHVSLTCAALLALVMLPVGPALPSARADGQAGTTLSAYKTATGFCETRIDYDWTVVKTANPTEAQLDPGECVDIHYTIEADREVASTTTVHGVRGSICVTNGGDRPTEGLAITDTVQFKVGSGQFQNLITVNVDVSENPVLDPGESHCYDYEVVFEPVAGAQYRNTAQVTITNHSGHLGEPFGPGFGGGGVKAGFTIPTECTVVEYDKCATVTDVVTIPPELSTGDPCVPSQTMCGPWTIEDDTTLHCVVRVCNVDAPCGLVLEVENCVTLTECDSGDTHTSCAVTTITTQACEQQCDEACTHTQGYFKNHPDDWCGVTSLTLGTVTYNQQQLLAIFGQEVEGNGLVALAHQLIAAKLNLACIGAGCTPDSVEEAIAQADALIGDKVVPPVGNGFLHPSVTSSLVTTLTAFNEGQSGVPHCD